MQEPTFRSLPCTSGHDDEDRDLVASYLGGNAAAFTTLMVRYQRPIYNAAFWILRRAEDANDVSQTVFLKVAERARDYDPGYRFFSWIYRIAVNESLNLLRRGAHETELDDDIDVPGPDSADPQWQASSAERTALIEKALMNMATNDRVVLSMRHFSDCSYREMAQILELDEKTVKSRLFEARRRLQSLLRDL